MKCFYSCLLALLCLSPNLYAQGTYKITADSVRLTGCDSTELIIENHTQNVKGFLFNTGNGRTIFKAALIKVNDSTLLVGADTLKLSSISWSLSGNSKTVDKVNFIGTTDNVPLNFRVNNINAGRIDVTGNIVAMGYLAADSTPGAATTTAIGYEAARFSAGPIAKLTTAVGYQALRTNRGPYNTAIGASALYQNGLSGGNTAVGYSALSSNATGNNNTAVGMSSLIANISGLNNVGIGTAALNGIKTGSSNVGIGNNVMALCDGWSNTAIGRAAAPNLTSGAGNVFIGDSTGMLLVSGSYNTIVGSFVSNLPRTLNNNIIIADGQGHRRINIDSFGNFMINTTTPLARNTFSGTGNFSDTLTATTIGNTDSSNRVATTAWVRRQGYSGMAMNGVLNSSLAVNGPIKAKSLTLSLTGWPDYVFDSTYRLLPLKEVEGYIRQHSHLPGVPSAASVARNGLSVGDNEAVLLKKIEELTLYNIAQEKKIDELNKKVEELDTMKRELMELKQLIKQTLK